MGSQTKVRGLLNVFRESVLPDKASLAEIRATVPEKFKHATDLQIADSWGKALAHRTLLRSIPASPELPFMIEAQAINAERSKLQPEAPILPAYPGRNTQAGEFVELVAQLITLLPVDERRGDPISLRLVELYYNARRRVS
jgi:hypothetical protein